MTEQNRLLKILKELSYEEGDFTLASGKKSSFYIDCKETTLNPEGMYLVGTLMYQLVQTIPGVDAVGGVSVGGDPQVCSTVLISCSFVSSSLERLHSMIASSLFAGLFTPYCFFVTASTGDSCISFLMGKSPHVAFFRGAVSACKEFLYVA